MNMDRTKGTRALDEAQALKTKHRKQLWIDIGILFAVIISTLILFGERKENWIGYSFLILYAVILVAVILRHAARKGAFRKEQLPATLIVIGLIACVVIVSITGVWQMLGSTGRIAVSAVVLLVTFLVKPARLFNRDSRNDKAFAHPKVVSTKEEITKRKKQKFAYVFFGILAFGAFLMLVDDSGTDDIYGAYYSEGGKYNNHIDIYQSGDVLLHYDGQFGHGNRWGRYSLSEDKKRLTVVFNDGGPELSGPLQIETHNSKLCVNNGGTLFVRSDSHPDNFIEPEAKRSYSR